MVSQGQDSSEGQNTWAPSKWNMYGNTSQVIEGLKKKADVRVNFSPRELGSDAGRFVLDQYYAAKGETGVGTVIQAAFTSHNLTLLIAKILPLIGIIAAIGVDYAIYGAAAKNMDKSHMLFNLNAFGIGSLIFAGALGLSRKYESWLIAATIIATVGASFIVADDNKNELRQRFTRSLSSAFTTGYDDEANIVKSINGEIANYNIIIKENTERLKKGNNGLNMTADKSKGNDTEAALYTAKIATAEVDRSKAILRRYKAQAEYEIAIRKDFLGLLGRLIATFYIGSWLLAAQLLIAEIVRSASSKFRGVRNKISEQKLQRKFFLDLENADQETRKSTIRAAVDTTLSQFSEILSNSKGDANKLNNFAKLFEEDQYDKMVKAATEMVAAGIIPKRSVIMKTLKYYKLYQSRNNIS